MPKLPWRLPAWPSMLDFHGKVWQASNALGDFKEREAVWTGPNEIAFEMIDAPVYRNTSVNQSRAEVDAAPVLRVRRSFKV